MTTKSVKPSMECRTMTTPAKDGPESLSFSLPPTARPKSFKIPYPTKELDIPASILSQPEKNDYSQSR